MFGYNTRKYRKINTGVTLIPVTPVTPVTIFLSQENHSKLHTCYFPYDIDVMWNEVKDILKDANINISELDISDSTLLNIKSEPKEKPDSYTSSSERE